MLLHRNPSLLCHDPNLADHVDLLPYFDDLSNFLEHFRAFPEIVGFPIVAEFAIAIVIYRAESFDLYRIEVRS
jgi:hypothetical protein